MSLLVPLPDLDGRKTLRRGLAFAAAAPAPRVGRPAPVARLVALAACGAALLGAALSFGGGREAAPPAPALPPAPARQAVPAPWIDVVHPFVAYDVAGGPFARLPMRYAARRSSDGDGREDTLSYGETRPGETFLRLTFARLGADPPPVPSLFVDAVRLAGGAGLAVTRSTSGFRLDTRFGPFEVAGVTIAGNGLSADCQAMRLDAPASAAVLRLVGLACGGTAAVLTPEAIACTLDKVDLVSAGDDEALRAVFVAAERRRRDACAAVRGTAFPRAPGDPRPGSTASLKGTF